MPGMGSRAYQRDKWIGLFSVIRGEATLIVEIVVQSGLPVPLFPDADIIRTLFIKSVHAFDASLDCMATPRCL